VARLREEVKWHRPGRRGKIVKARLRALSAAPRRLPERRLGSPFNLAIGFKAAFWSRPWTLWVFGKIGAKSNFNHRPNLGLAD
jgi:hypothetical protein